MRAKVNLNTTIHVKLTQKGIDILEKKYNTIFQDFPDMPSRKVQVSENGYTTFQLWQFIADFGEHTYMGMLDLPFATDIIVDEVEPLSFFRK